MRSDGDGSSSNNSGRPQNDNQSNSDGDNARTARGDENANPTSELGRSVGRSDTGDVGRSTSRDDTGADTESVKELHEFDEQLKYRVEQLKPLFEFGESVKKAFDSPTRYHLLEAGKSTGDLVSDIHSATGGQPPLIEQISRGWTSLNSTEKVVVGATVAGLAIAGGVAIASSVATATAAEGIGAALAEVAEYGGGLAKGLTALQVAVSIGLNAAAESSGSNVSVVKAIASPILGGLDVLGHEIVERINKIDEALFRLAE